MQEHNLKIAETFYTAMAKKNIEELEKHLHPDIQFTAPLAKTKGKKDYLAAAQNFMEFFKSLTICAKFASENQAMIRYDVEFPSIGIILTAALMTFEKDLIKTVELVYDARPFETKKG